MGEKEFDALNEKLLAQFKTIDFSKVKSIHIFLPIIIKREPNTFLIIDWLQENHQEIQIIVPKANFDTNLMSNHVFTKQTNLANNHYDIPEPKEGYEFLGVPDLVIVPLLAFDKKGYRVGYGKGFYDRFLQNSKTLKIGLSFFAPTEEIIDVHLNDVRLDKCITPAGIIEF